MANDQLAAIRVDRRAIAIVILQGLKIEFAQVRYLLSSFLLAEKTILGFLNRTLDTFPVPMVALEKTLAGRETRSEDLKRVVSDQIHDLSIPIWQVTLPEVLESFGVPAPKYRIDVRRVLTTIWPALDSPKLGGLVQDAAGLGLYIQTERLLSLNIANE